MNTLKATKAIKSSNCAMKFLFDVLLTGEFFSLYAFMEFEYCRNFPLCMHSWSLNTRNYLAMGFCETRTCTVVDNYIYRGKEVRQFILV